MADALENCKDVSIEAPEVGPEVVADALALFQSSESFSKYETESLLKEGDSVSSTQYGLGFQYLRHYSGASLIDLSGVESGLWPSILLFCFLCYIGIVAMMSSHQALNFTFCQCKIFRLCEIPHSCPFRLSVLACLAHPLARLCTCMFLV